MCDCLCAGCIHAVTKSCRPCLPRCAKGFGPVRRCEAFTERGEERVSQCLSAEVRKFNGVVVCPLGTDCEECYEDFERRINEQENEAEPGAEVTGRC